MLVAYITYVSFTYLFVSRKILNLCNLTLLYIMLGIYIGAETIKYSAQWVQLTDFIFLQDSIFYLKIGFYVVMLSFLIFQMFFKERSLKKNYYHNFDKLIINNISWILILFASIPLYVVFIDIYVPVFESKTHISKYFQDRLEDFIPYRPFYTLSINALSTLLFMQINHLLFVNKKLTILKLPFKKSFFKILFMTATLFLTAKRGQLYLPIFISMVAYLLYRRKIIQLSVLGSFMIILVGLSRNYNKILSGDFNFEDIFMSLSTSFLVSVRELTRVLMAFNNNAHEYLLGKTYIAGFFSFIPTKINFFKEKYNYMRYTSHISNHDPDLYGGMRSTYLGEAYVNFGLLGVILAPVVFALIVYICHLIVLKYSKNRFLFYLLIFWFFKLIIYPIYENGSTMFLFFLITVLFMIIPSLQLTFKKERVLLRIKFLTKNGHRKI